MADIETIALATRYFAESSAPGTPDSGKAVLYVDTSGKLHIIDDAGTDTELGAGGGGDITADAAWAAKGDLIVGTGDDTAQVLSVGANGSYPRAASGQTTGIEWQKNNLAASTAPAVTDDVDEGYTVGSRWIDTTADKEYVCLDNTDGAAVWTETTQSGGGGGVTEHAYVTGTSTVTVSSTNKASPTSVISTSSIDVGAGAIDIEFWCHSHRLAAGDLMNLLLYEDSSVKGRLALMQNTDGGNQRETVYARYRYTPGAGSKTFSVRAWMEAGSNGLLGAGAAGDADTGVPMVLRITSAPA